MIIQSIDIKNFRCFDTLHLDFESLHGLIGENGTGKTAVIEALNLITSSSYTASRVNEQDFHNADLGDIEMKMKFDHAFIMRIADGYTHQDIPCDGITLNIKRRQQAGGGKALSDPFVVEHYATPITYTDKSSLDNTAYASDEAKLKIPNSVSQTGAGYKSPRKTSENDFNFTDRQLTLQNDTFGFPQVFYFDKSREKESRTGYNTLLNRIANDLNWRFRNKWDKDETTRLWEEYYNKTVDVVIDPKKGRVLKPVQEKLQEYTGRDYSSLELSLLSIEEPFSKAFFAERRH